MIRRLAAGLLLSAAIFSGADARGPSTPLSLSIPNFTPNGGFPHWQACREQVQKNLADCNVLIIGESTSTGHGSFFRNTSGDARSGAFPNQLAGILRSFGINAQTNSISGNSHIEPYGTFDTRVRQAGWLIDKANFTFGGSAWKAADDTALVFDPTDRVSYPSVSPVMTDTLDVYYHGLVSGGGNLTVDTGGSPICTIYTTTGTTAFNKATCSTGLAGNTYAIRCDGTHNCIFNTIVARNSSLREVSILNGSADGATAGNFNASTGSPWDTLPAIRKFAPALCIVMDIGNDVFLQESTISRYTAHLTNIVNACKASGDVLLMTGLPYGLALPGPITAPEYQAAVSAVASSTKSPIWDTLATWGGYGADQNGWSRTGMNTGWNASCCGGAADKAHWSIGSNVFMATMISIMLLQ
jgi:hypothetical protein